MPQRWNRLPIAFAFLFLLGAFLEGARVADRPERRVLLLEEFEHSDSLVLQAVPAGKGRVVDGAFQWQAGARVPSLRSPPLQLEGGPFDTVRVRIAVDPPGPTRLAFAFKRREDAQEFVCSEEFDATGSLEERVLRPALMQVWGGPIARFRIQLEVPEGSRGRIDRVEFSRDSGAYDRAGLRPRFQAALRALEERPRLVVGCWLLACACLVARPPRGRGRFPSPNTRLSRLSPRFRLFAPVFLLSLVPRLLYSAIPILDFLLMGDPGAYRDLALGIWSGDRPRGDPVWGWGWQGLLALLLGPSGGEALFGARLFLALAGAATSGLVALIARSAGARPGVAALAGLLHAGLEEPIRVGGLLYGETLYSLAGAGLLLCALEAARRRPARGTTLALGLSSAVAVLVRSQALPWIALAGIHLLVRRGVRATAARGWPALAGVAVAVAVSLPLSLAQSGAWIPLQTGSGVNLAVGNVPGGDGRWTELPREWIRATREARLADRPLERDSIYRELALAEIRRDPLAALRRAANRAWFFFEPFERNDWFYRPAFPGPLIPRGFLIAAFLAGLAFGRRRCPGYLLPLAWVGASWAVVIAFLHHERYIVPAMPAMCPIAAAGLTEAGARVLRALERLSDSAGHGSTPTGLRTSSDPTH